MEKEVLSFFLEGKEYTEIAEILGKTDKSIDNALQRIKAKIRKISMPDRAN
jgi:RNA polymerase sporulation-specific sigma factor